jgi:transglutaminase-like putative cysteine protease
VRVRVATLMLGVVVAGLAVLGTGCNRISEGTTVPARDFPTLVPDDLPIDPYADAGPSFAAPIESSSSRAVGSFIPSAIDIGDPRTVASLTIDLKVGAYELPSAPNHRVTTLADGTRRVIVTPTDGAKVTKTDRAGALEATDAYDTGTARVRQAARDAVAGEKDARRRVDKLVTFVYERIAYALDNDAFVASEILDRGKGDCSEMTILFVAMARSAGIPARSVVGLASTYEDTRSGFGFHAWAEVAIDGRWIAVDPTWNETIADATHVPLYIGDDYYTLGPALDGLELAVVEIVRDPTIEGIADVRLLARALPAHLTLSGNDR